MGWPLIGESLRLKEALKSSNPYAFYEKRMSKWGDIFMTHLAGSLMLTTVSPEAAKEILSQENSLFVTKYPLYGKKLLGEFTLLELHGDTHKRIRRLHQPFLQPEKLKSFMGTVDHLIISNLEEHERKGVFLACDLCKQTTFDVITKLMMNVDRGPESDAIFRDFDCWRMALRYQSKYPVLHLARARMGAVIESICKKRQDEGTVGKHLDLLDTLLTEHESEGGPPLTFQQKENLDLRKKVGADKLVSWSELKSLDYTAKVINEGLRITSPAAAVYREALRDTKLFGFLIPSGLRVQIPMSAIHRDPRNYKDPAKFNPERWQEGKPAGKGLTFLSVADLGFACSNGAYVVSSPPGLQIQVSPMDFPSGSAV